MSPARTTVAAVLLAVEGGLALLGVLVHYGLVAEYGDVTASALGQVWSGFSTGIGGLALALVGAAALVVLLTSSLPWMRVSALAMPVLMVVGMAAVTPAALSKKLDLQYDASPRCVSDEERRPGPGTRAARESQRAFESIEHIGHFGGGGGSGVGGCDRPLLVTDDSDLLRHYRAALPEAGWQVVEDRQHRLRAERGRMAFELVTCERGGVVWAGPVDDGGNAQCVGDDEVGPHTR